MYIRKEDHLRSRTVSVKLKLNIFAAPAFIANFLISDGEIGVADLFASPAAT
jgi:hypothetical protein